MLLVGALALFVRRHIARLRGRSWWRCWWCSRWTERAVLSAGFWLSFGAVAVILAVLGGRVAPAARLARRTMRVQFAISFALVPLPARAVPVGPLLSPLANLIAIPLVSFVITPLVLLAIPWPTPLLLVPADLAAGWMMAFCTPRSARGWRWSGVRYRRPGCSAAHSWRWRCCCCRAQAGSAGGAGLLAGLLFWQPPRPQEVAFAPGCWMSAGAWRCMYRTRAHDLLHDSGPASAVRPMPAERVILPWLRAAGVRRLDRLVLASGRGPCLAVRPRCGSIPVGGCWLDRLAMRANVRTGRNGSARDASLQTVRLRRRNKATACASRYCILRRRARHAIRPPAPTTTTLRACCASPLRRVRCC